MSCHTTGVPRTPSDHWTMSEHMANVLPPIQQGMFLQKSAQHFATQAQKDLGEYCA